MGWLEIIIFIMMLWYFIGLLVTLAEDRDKEEC